MIISQTLLGRNVLNNIFHELNGLISQHLFNLSLNCLKNECKITVFVQVWINDTTLHLIDNLMLNKILLYVNYFTVKYINLKS
jgi:hypothetical protein